MELLQNISREIRTFLYFGHLKGEVKLSTLHLENNSLLQGRDQWVFLYLLPFATVGHPSDLCLVITHIEPYTSLNHNF